MKRKSTLDTRPLKAIARRLVTLKIQIEQMVPVAFDAVEAVEKSHKNIVAAHKAHTTMAKKAGHGERTCVHCGCTDGHACPGGCAWAIMHRATLTGVCTRCVPKEVKLVDAL